MSAARYHDHLKSTASGHRGSADTASPCAVIFDLDGVLIDSYRAHLKSWQLLAAETGVTLTERQFAAFFGRPGRDVIRHFWQGNDLTNERTAELYRRKQVLYRRVARDLTAVDGAIELIDALHEAGFRLAIASAGPRENAELALHTLGRSSLFSVRVTAEDVKCGKPDPEVYSITAKRLGMKARWCMAVEDAPAGIAAAKAAGMAAIGLVGDGRTAGELTSADHVVYSLRELSPENIRELINAHQ